MPWFEVKKGGDGSRKFMENPCINMQMNVFHNNNNNKQMILHFKLIYQMQNKREQVKKNAGQLDSGTYPSSHDQLPGFQSEKKMLDGSAEGAPD